MSILLLWSPVHVLQHFWLDRYVCTICNISDFVMFVRTIKIRIRTMNPNNEYDQPDQASILLEESITASTNHKLPNLVFTECDFAI